MNTELPNEVIVQQHNTPLSVLWINSFGEISKKDAARYTSLLEKFSSHLSICEYKDIVKELGNTYLKVTFDVINGESLPKILNLYDIPKYKLRAAFDRIIIRWDLKFEEQFAAIQLSHDEDLLEERERKIQEFIERERIRMAETSSSDDSEEETEEAQDRKSVV